MRQVAKWLRMLADKLDKPVDTLPLFSWDISKATYTTSSESHLSITIESSGVDAIYRAVGDLGLYSLDDGLEGNHVV